MVGIRPLSTSLRFSPDRFCVIYFTAGNVVRLHVMCSNLFNIQSYGNVHSNSFSILAVFFSMSVFQEYNKRIQDMLNIPKYDDEMPLFCFIYIEEVIVINLIFLNCVSSLSGTNSNSLISCLLF